MRRELIILATLAAMAVGVDARAQSGSVFTATGLQPHREYLSLLPFEHIDTASGGLTLTFTDLVLPGHAGRDLRVVRSYNAKTQLWTFGLAGIVLRVEHGPNAPVLLHLGDGGTAVAGTAMPYLGVDIRMTDRFWRYFTNSKILWMPDGSVSQFDPTTGRLSSMTDAFGNTISVTWSDLSVTVTQSVGTQSRQIVLTLPTACALGKEGCLPTRMTFLDREWQYSLTSMTPPAGTGPGWSFAAGTGGSSWTVTTPHGGQIVYALGPHEFRIDPNDPNSTILTSVVTTRTVTNVGAQADGTWTYDYDFQGSSLSTLTTVTAPNDVVTTFEHGWTPDTGTASNAYPGRFYVLKKRTLTKASVEWERDTRTYQSVSIPSANTSDVLPEIDTRTIVRHDGGLERTHTTTFDYSPNTWGDFHHPNAIVETGQLASGTQIRATTRTYQHSSNAPITPLYLVGLLTGETVATGGDTTARAWAYDSEGFVESATEHGITTTFTQDGFGNVATATSEEGTTTAFTYDWGRVKNTITAAHTTTRVINEDGTVASETQAGRTTTFEYDDASRPIAARPPGGVLAIVTTYASNGASVTTTRGTSSVVTTLDGFGRPIGTVTAVTGGSDLKTTTTYDTHGRVRYAGLPFVGSADKGTTIDYDPLGRMTKETHSDSTHRDYAYGAGTVTVIDEAGNDTVQTLAPFGHPDDARLVTLVDADNKTWDYTYNAQGAVRTVTLNGTSQTRTWEYDDTTKLRENESHQESGTVTYLHDDAGRLERKTDALSTQTAYVYDANDRLESVTAGSRQTTLTFETGSDNLKTMTVAGVATEFSYDAAGRVWKRTDTLDSQTFTTTYTYDTLDRVDTITYPSGRVVGYDYDTASRVTRVFDPVTNADFAHTFSYHASGAVAGFTAGNTTTTTQGYDANRYWVTSITSGPLQLAYDDHDAVGNVERVTDSRSGHTQTFGYDALHRLTSASGIYGPKGYTYDAHGNPLTGFTYGSNPFRPTHVDSQALGYDGAGRLRTAPDVTYDYTPDHQLETATVGGTTSTFAYDGDGWRIKKVVGGTTSYFVRGVGGELLAERTTTGSTTTWRDYVYAGGRLLAVVTTTNVTALPSGCVFETPLLSGDTVITAVLVTELRTCVNNLRTQRGLSTATWTDPTLTPQQTVIKAVHLAELRTALSAVYTAASLSAPVYTDPTLVTGETTIKAVYFTELRGAVREFPPLIAAPAVHYYHLDAIGSVRAITNASGTTVARYDYEPFGAEVTPAATERDPLQFAGTERDAETGTSSWQPLDYLGARYTQNRLGRFLNPDDPSYGNPFDPQSMNQYAYAYNNPLGFVDPTGHQGDCTAGYDASTGRCERDWAWEQAQQFFQESERNLNQQLAAAAQQQREQQSQAQAASRFNADAKRLLRTAGSCAAEHYGLTAAAAGIGALGVPVPKAWLGASRGLAGASESTSVAGAIGYSLFGRAEPRIGTRILGTTRVFGIIGRAAPVVSAGLFAWDAISIGYCTYQGMN
jgi:RHS repeat-associated protein